MELASELPWSFNAHLPETIGQLRNAGTLQEDKLADPSKR